MPKIVPKSVPPNVFWTCFGVIFSKNFFAQCSMVGRVCPKWKFLINSKNFQNSINSQKSPKRVLNMFWGNFFEKFFCPVFHGGSSQWKSFPNCPKVFWTCFGVLFPEISLCEVFHGGSSLRNGFKKSKNLQNSKNAQNRSQKCPNVLWTCFGVIFSRNFFCPVFHVGSSLRNVFKKISKFKKRPKSFPICPNVFSTCFGGIFSRIYFAQCSMEGRVCETFLKIFQNSKDAQNRSQKRPNVFWTCFGVNSFEEIFFAQCSMEGRVFEMFSKNQKISSVPCRVESSKFFREIFFAQCSMEGRVFEMFLKNFQNSKNAQNRSQIVQRVLNVFWCNFFENVFCPVFHGGSSLWNIFK